MHGPREQRNHQLALPAGHLYADIGPGLWGRVQCRRLQDLIVHPRGRRLELAGQEPAVGLDVEAVDEKALLDEYVGKASLHVAETGIAKCADQRIMQVSAGEWIRSLRLAIIVFLTPADIQDQPLAVKMFPLPIKAE
jgi:hypothetical protein